MSETGRIIGLMSVISGDKRDKWHAPRTDRQPLEGFCAALPAISRDDKQDSPRQPRWYLHHILRWLIARWRRLETYHVINSSSVGGRLYSATGDYGSCRLWDIVLASIYNDNTNFSNKGFLFLEQKKESYSFGNCSELISNLTFLTHNLEATRRGDLRWSRDPSGRGSFSWSTAFGTFITIGSQRLKYLCWFCEKR